MLPTGPNEGARASERVRVRPRGREPAVTAPMKRPDSHLCRGRDGQVAAGLVTVVYRPAELGTNPGAPAVTRTEPPATHRRAHRPPTAVTLLSHRVWPSWLRCQLLKRVVLLARPFRHLSAASSLISQDTTVKQHGAVMALPPDQARIMLPICPPSASRWLHLLRAGTALSQ